MKMILRIFREKSGKSAAKFPLIFDFSHRNGEEKKLFLNHHVCENTVKMFISRNNLRIRDLSLREERKETKRGNQVLFWVENLKKFSSSPYIWFSRESETDRFEVMSIISLTCD